MKCSMKVLLLSFSVMAVACSGAADVRKFQAQLRFEPNVHQAAPEVRCLSRGTGPQMLLRDREVGIVMGTSLLRMRFAGATTDPQIGGEELLP